VIVKKLLLRKALNEALDRGTVKGKKAQAVRDILRPLRFRAFAALQQAADDLVESETPKGAAGALGDGTILKLLLDNLDKIVAAILAILKAWPTAGEEE
jgi:hypothetical protein